MSSPGDNSNNLTVPNGEDVQKAGKTTSDSNNMNSAANNPSVSTSIGKGQTVSIKDVQAATPEESGEERIVMQSIEAQDPTGSLSKQFDQTVPFGTSETGATTKTTTTTSTRPGHRRNSNHLDGDFVMYLSSINEIHRQLNANADAPASIYRTDEPETETDAFAADAGKLFHRFQKKRPHPNNEGPSGEASMRMSTRKKSNHPNLAALKEFEEALMSKSNRRYAWSYCKDLICFIIVPTVGLACLLFYAFDNPGTNMDVWDAIQNSTTPEKDGDRLPEGLVPLSYSYWILFWFCRQAITYAIAKFLQFFIMTVVHRTTVIGPLPKLVVLQSRGWPLHCILWGATDFILMYGEGEFGKHWLFFQDFMGVFNAENPSGGITTSPVWRAFLIFVIITGLLITAKRFLIGLMFGKNSYIRYAGKMTETLMQILVVSKLAKFAVSNRDCREFNRDGADVETLQGWYHAGPKEDDATEESEAMKSPASAPQEQAFDFFVDDRLTESQIHQIAFLLEEWEDTEVIDKRNVESPSLGSIVQFRASIGVLDSEWPFSPAYGSCRTRKDGIEGAQKLYFNLLRKQSASNSDDLTEEAGDSVLRFYTIALAAMRRDGSFDEKMAQDLVTLFRPTRDGDIGVLEFCKSMDNLYKEMQKLRASIASESRMNAASESFINYIFYFILIVVGLAVVGLDPVALFAFLSAIIVGVAFMISGASSDFFRGILFVLVQRPYDIGDRINIAGVEDDAPLGGSPGWIVKDVTLYYTTVVYAITQEYATFTNGSLAQSRIINMARSPKAQVPFFMKFGIKVPTTTIDELKADLMVFVKAKPREWLVFATFRITRIEADLGFVEYIIILQHRESWQQIGAVLTSLGEAQTYAFNRSKELGMDYHAPTLPVEMRLASNPKGSNNPSNSPTDPFSNMNTALTSMFGVSGNSS